MLTPKDIADDLDEGLRSDIFYDAHDYGDESAQGQIEKFHRAVLESAVILRQLEAPDHWLAVVTDENGNRVNSALIEGDNSTDSLRKRAGEHFGDLPAGHNCRFHPIGPDRVDLAFGFAGDIPSILYAVDGREYDDPDSPLTGDGKFGPFEIFDIKAQDWLPGQYSTREGAQIVADLLNKK